MSEFKVGDVVRVRRENRTIGVGAIAVDPNIGYRVALISRRGGNTTYHLIAISEAIDDRDTWDACLTIDQFELDPFISACNQSLGPDSNG